MEVYLWWQESISHQCFHTSKLSQVSCYMMFAKRQWESLTTKFRVFPCGPCYFVCSCSCKHHVRVSWIFQSGWSLRNFFFFFLLSACWTVHTLQAHLQNQPFITFKGNLHYAFREVTFKIRNCGRAGWPIGKWSQCFAPAFSCRLPLSCVLS